MELFLARILGKRSFTIFFLVTFLVVTILAAASIASRFALKQYVEEQLQRIHWDISAYQTGDLQATGRIGDALEETEGVVDHNELLFLRNSMTTEDIAYVDGRPMRMPWLSLLTTSDTSMFPLSIRPMQEKAVLVLVGNKAQMGNAYAELQGASRLEVKVGAHHVSELDEDDQHGHSVDAFGIDLERIIRIERNELNRWFLEQTSSPSLIPEIGAILVTPYDEQIISSFDAVARGIVTTHDDGDLHEEAGSYFPDIIHLLNLDTDRLISGWDIGGSLDSLKVQQAALEANTFPVGPRTFVDNSAMVLLERMNKTAAQVGLISLLITLPLLWVGWILMAALCRMLLLHERRKFGLMRLRGASGHRMGRALQLAIGTGALLGGLLGAVFGTAIPLWIYEGKMLPPETIFIVQPPAMLLAFIAIGVGVALAVSVKLVRYASTVSPLEASGRVVNSELQQGNVGFGWPGYLALILGSYKMLGWIFSYSISDTIELPWLYSLDRALDFAGFPLFVYGLVGVLVTRKTCMNRLIQGVVGIIGGRLRALIAIHIATRPQRAGALILIVSMMTTISLYPTVMTAVFDNKIGRATRIQVGSDLQVTINAADIVNNNVLADGGVGEQYRALQQKIPELVATLSRVQGVESATWSLFEGVTDGVYVPGYGFNGLPVYFLPDKDGYLNVVHHEESLAQQGNFTKLVHRVAEDQVILSPAVSRFMDKDRGEMTPLGRRVTDDGMVQLKVAGATWYMPGSPSVSITDRESFDTARIDYVNHLFSNNAYMVADPNLVSIQDLDVLITGVQFAISLAPGVVSADMRDRLLHALPMELADIRTYDEELTKVGSDMYIFLARQNLDIYLIGGIVLAVIGILALAYTSFIEDRRTLALLRIRGAGPSDTLRFFGSGLFAPSLIGLVLGIAVAITAGYGITNLVWHLREVSNILSYLLTHIAVSELTVIIAMVLFLLILAVGLTFSKWAFRKTVREGLADH